MVSYHSLLIIKFLLIYVGFSKYDDKVPADKVPADKVPAGKVPADKVPADQVFDLSLLAQDLWC